MKENAPKIDSATSKGRGGLRKIEGGQEFWARWYSPLADAINNNPLVERRKDKQNVINFIIEDLQRQIGQEAESGYIVDSNLEPVIKRLQSPTGNTTEIPQKHLTNYIYEKIKKYDELQQVARPKPADLDNALLAYKEKLDEEARKAEILRQQIVEIDEKTQLPKGEKPDIKKQVKSVSRWVAAGLAIMAAFNAFKKHEAPEIPEPEKQKNVQSQPDLADNPDLQVVEQRDQEFKQAIQQVKELARQTHTENKQIADTNTNLDTEDETLLPYTVQPGDTFWGILQKKFPADNKNGIEQNAINKYWGRYSDLVVHSGEELFFHDDGTVEKHGNPTENHNGEATPEHDKVSLENLDTNLGLSTLEGKTNPEPTPQKQTPKPRYFDSQTGKNVIPTHGGEQIAFNVSKPQTFGKNLGTTPEITQKHPTKPAELPQGFLVEEKDNPLYHTATSDNTDEPDRDVTQDDERDQDTTQVEKPEKVKDSGHIIDQQKIEGVRSKILNYDATKRIGKTKKGETKSQPLELTPDEQAIAIDLLLDRAVYTANAIDINDIAMQMAKQTLSIENAREWYGQIFDVLNKTSREAKTMLGITEAGFPKQFYEHRLGQVYKQLGKYIDKKNWLETTPAEKEFFNSDDARVAEGETDRGD
ncbi:MAG TPA: hypothetical protein DEB09_02745 [Candidatus Magasanikbacteria bacterium]|nr:hypothetical protein [Candidatus Magasanikbacteria bacterium]